MAKETTDAHMNETTSIGNLVSYFNVSLKYLTVLKCRKYAEAGSSTIMTHQVKVQNQNGTSKHFANSIDISVVLDTRLLVPRYQVPKYLHQKRSSLDELMCTAHCAILDFEYRYPNLSRVG